MPNQVVPSPDTRSLCRLSRGVCFVTAGLLAGTGLAAAPGGASGTPPVPPASPTAPKEAPVAQGAGVLCRGTVLVAFRATAAGVTAQERAVLAQTKVAALLGAEVGAAAISMEADRDGAHLFGNGKPLFSIVAGEHPDPARAVADAMGILRRCLAGPAAAAPASRGASRPGAPEREPGASPGPEAERPRDLGSWWEQIRTLWNDQDLRELSVKVGVSAALLVGIPFVIMILGRIYRRAVLFTVRTINRTMRPLRFRKYEIVRPATVAAALVGLLQIVRLIVSLLAVYSGIAYGLTFFPASIRGVVEPQVRGALSAILVTYVAWILWSGFRTVFAAAQQWIHRARGRALRAVKIRNVELFSEGQVVEATQTFARLVRLAVAVVFAYMYITVAFSFFAFSAGWADALLGYVLAPLTSIGLGIVGFLPNLFFIVVMVLVTRYVIRFLRMFFEGVQQGRTALPGFHAEWGRPTFKIVSFVLIAFAAVLVFPYLPGAQSEAFKGVGLFVGLLFSLGSTAVVANVVAGIVLTYMRPFKVGDRVKIADTVGDVVESTLLVTRIRTVKNVEITVPNGLVLGAHIINYSAAVAEQGVVLHTAVTIGYDVPWREVHRLLLLAAGKTDLLLKEPEAFVLQTELSDFYVAYELNCHTSEPQRMARIYSELHQNIQDVFNEAGVEILSPHYRAQRDGNQVTIPGAYLPESYEAPGFRVERLEK